MIEKLFKKSEVWFAVSFIIAYVVGNSILMQFSDSVGIEMIFSIPFNLLLIVLLFIFIKKNDLSEYYGLCGVKTQAKNLLFYVPLVIVGTVNVWMGFRLKWPPLIR